MRYLFIFSTILVSLFFPAPARAEYVVRVIDGDTCVVAGKYGDLHIRLKGIDAPEMRQPYGKEAQKHLEELILGKYVELTIISTNRNRIVAELTHKGENIQKKLLAAGSAWLVIKFCTENQKKQWGPLTEAARKKKLGLWANPNAIAPWKWRVNSRK